MVSIIAWAIRSSWDNNSVISTAVDKSLDVESNLDLDRALEADLWRDDKSSL